MGTVAHTKTSAVSALSPFRYPGGKAWLTGALEAELRRIAPGGGAYVEPYAGGAGAAIKLLANGAASQIFLNDRDPRIYAAWKSILEENDRFLDALSAAVPNIETWWACKRIVDNPSCAVDRFEIGFSSFFLNRTNRSGILQGAAPIGGYEQSGTWKLDARFYRETLLGRVRWLGSMADRINISRLDGLKFLQRMERHVNLDASLFFIDPPYVGMGSRLYLNAMAEDDHRDLASYLDSGMLKNWIVTYDDDPLIRNLYERQVSERTDVRYTLQKKRVEKEILIRPMRSRKSLPAPVQKPHG